MQDHLRYLAILNSLFTRGYFWISLFALSGALWLIIKRKNTAKSNGKDIFLLAAIFSLICLFIVPDSFSVGMMSIRLCFYFFLFFMLWLALQQNFTAIKWGATVSVYIIFWLLFFTCRYKILNEFDVRIRQMVEASDKYIEPNKVVLPVDCTHNWIMPHMVDYIAIHKPMVNLMDYELGDRWFP